MIKRIRYARRFLHTNHPTTTAQIDRFQIHALRFLSQFASQAEFDRFYELWTTSFVVPLGPDVVLKTDSDDEIPLAFNRDRARVALLLLISIVQRAEASLRDAAAQNVMPREAPPLPTWAKTARSKAIWGKMQEKGFSNQRRLAVAAKVDEATVNRFIKNAKPTPGGAPRKAQERILTALGATEADLPN